MTERTRLGKEVGSVKRPLKAWTYWKQDGKWYAVAPSGARVSTHDTEREAADEAARQNEMDA